MGHATRSARALVAVGGRLGPNAKCPCGHALGGPGLILMVHRAVRRRRDGGLGDGAAAWLGVAQLLWTSLRT